MANKKRRKADALGSAAESVGRALGHVANRLDRLHKQRETISAEIRRLAHSGTAMLAKIRGEAKAEARVVRAAARRGRKAGFKMTAAARRKMSIAAKKRYAAVKKAVSAKG